MSALPLSFEELISLPLKFPSKLGFNILCEISEIEIPYKCSFSTLIKENKSGFEISVEYYISELSY